MLFLNVALQGMAIGIAVISALVILVKVPQTHRRFAPLAFAISLTGYMMTHGPQATEIPDIAHVILITVCGFLPATIVWIALDILMDWERGKRIWVGLCLIVVPLSLLAYFDPAFMPLKLGAILIIYIGLLIAVLLSWDNDLLNCRRLCKTSFLLVTAGASACMVGAELFTGAVQFDMWQHVMQTTTIVLLVATFNLWLLSNYTLIFSEPLTPKSNKTHSSEDRWIIEKLQTVMAQGIWQREGLTISALATDLGVPEYKLRDTINHHMGYRNFPAFINSYRIKAAQAALSDPQLTGKSILEIAYDSGFSSLGPFNRAFREISGQSPSQFRKTALN